MHQFPVTIAGHDSSGSPALPVKALGSSSVVEKIVDADIFQQGQEHEEEAYNHIDVNGLDTGKMGEFFLQM